MGESGYPVPAGVHRVEDVVRRSRFLTTLAHAPDPAAAQAFVEVIKREMSDATHHCWAYVAGPPGSTARVGASDAGEPRGTAGRPMLNVLLHGGIGEVVAVTSRWFGGTKLGTGGLARLISVRSVVRIYPGPLNLRESRVRFPLLDSRCSGSGTGSPAVLEGILELPLVGLLVALEDRLRGLPAAEFAQNLQRLVHEVRGELLPQGVPAAATLGFQSLRALRPCSTSHVPALLERRPGPDRCEPAGPGPAGHLCDLGRMLPGVVSPSDLSASFHVRGGSSDQNLILLDGVPVFSSFHLGEFFSVFNPDMVDRSSFNREASLPSTEVAYRRTDGSQDRWRRLVSAHGAGMK